MEATASFEVCMHGDEESGVSVSPSSWTGVVGRSCGSFKALLRRSTQWNAIAVVANSSRPQINWQSHHMHAYSWETYVCSTHHATEANSYYYISEHARP